MTPEFRPLSPTIGAEVLGVDLSRPLDAGVSKRLLDAWHGHVLLLFRDQRLDDDGLKRSAGWVGTMGSISMPTTRRGDQDSQISLVSNIRDAAGRAIGALGDGDMWFHHDNSFVANPDQATFLYAVELPSSGGNTLFSNGYRAYDALPTRLCAAIAGRRVLQVYDYSVRGKPDISQLDAVRHYWQPAVVRHPVTGRRALYVDRLMTAAIEGYDRADSDALLEELFAYVERADYEHVWRLGDYVIWDNRCSAHARTDFPAAERRLLKRGKIAGGPLLAAEAA
jgi:taurine dioxygenase